MTYIRRKLFSTSDSGKRKKRTDTKKNYDNRVLAGDIALGLGLTSGGFAHRIACSKANSVMRHIVDKHKNKQPSREEEEEVKKLVKHLKEKAQAQGTTITEDPDLGSWHNPKERRINISSPKNNAAKAVTLAHEYGHSKYAEGGSKEIIGKLSHKGYQVSKVISHPESDIFVPIQYGTKLGLKHAAFFANGFDSGYRTEKKKAKGEKDSVINKAKPYLVPIALSAPMLLAEGAASRQGLKELKKAGASKSVLKEARKELGAAWGTYASLPAVPVLTGELGRIAGKGAAKRDFYNYKTGKSRFDTESDGKPNKNKKKHKNDNT